MKKFRFNLGTLLQFRCDKEHHAQKELMVQKDALDLLIEDRNVLQSEGNDIEQEIRNIQETGTSSLELAHLLDYLQVLRERTADKQDEVMKASNLVENKRTLLATAMKERKVIEKFRETKYEKWEKECTAKEKGFLDELATIRYVRDKQN